MKTILNSKLHFDINSLKQTFTVKNLLKFARAAILLLLLIPLQATAISIPAANPTPTECPVMQAQATALMVRLDEIKAIDKTGLSSMEKKVLRKETRSIKKQLREIGGGVYLSIGAIIIIVLLLILLL
jgi:hypothetical protein